MKTLYSIGLIVLLTSCSSASTVPEQISSVSSKPSSVALSSVASSLVSYEYSLQDFIDQEFTGSDFELDEVLASNSAYTRYKIFYTSNGLRISGIINIPTGNGPYPLLILNHGYIDPAVYTNGRGLKREQDYLAKNGYAVLHTDYRNHAFSDTDTFNDSRFRSGYAADAINAALAVQAANLPTINANRIGLLGHSMGGGVTLKALIAKPKLFKAAVLFAPVSSNEQQNYDRWTVDRGEVVVSMREQYGATLEDDDFWFQASAQSQLGRIQVPIINHHGSQDSDVPLDWSRQLESELTSAGVQNELYIYEGEPHEFIQAWPIVMQRTLDHFDKNVKADTVANNWQWPVDAVVERLSKKPFGLYVTPQNSPVENEIFTGFHTGVDLELLPNETAADVMVKAACNGPLLQKQWVSGYGGVVLQECNLKGDVVTVLYGHVSLNSVLANVGTVMQVGEPLASLGQGFGNETDGERAHLHFGIINSSRQELRGYVQTEAELAGWINPTTFINTN